MKDKWRKRIYGWNSRLKQRKAGFRIDRPWVDQFQKCPYCHVELTPENAGLDHKTPLCLNGTDHHTNLHLCCMTCNRAKSSLTHPQMLALIHCLNEPPFNQGAKIMMLRKMKSAWRVQ